MLAVAAERARAIELEVEILDIREGLVGEDLIGAVIAYTGTEGDIYDPRGVIEELHTRGAVATIVADPLSLLLLEAPGKLGADIVIGSTQRFGVPLFFGGPHAAFMAVTDKLKRQMPGRLVGVSRTPRAARRTAWPCRPVSSTSAVNALPPTSVPRRRCWPT